MFKLLRYFSIASLFAFLIVIFVLGVFYRQTTIDVLVELEGEKNIALAQVFANSTFEELQSITGTNNETDSETGLEVETLLRLFDEQARGLPVVKIKIYDVNGVTVFSTDPVQIGENQFENDGFQSAIEGKPISSLVHRDTFNAFDMVLEDRDLIQSYIPIYARDNENQIVAVFELYSDVTELLGRIQRTQFNVLLFVVTALIVLYSVLFLIVRRADQIIRTQYAELDRAKTEITNARDQAVKANFFKTRLLENVSHDMRTPMSVIVGYVDLLSDTQYGPVNDKQLRALKRIQLSAGNLSDLVNDLLKQGQIDADELTLQVAAFELTDLVASVRTHLKLPAENKGLDTEIIVDPNLPAKMKGDLLHLKQTVNNLTSNAIKFTEQGKITVSFASVSAQIWRVSVRDTGPGIPEDKLDLIFEPFQQLDNTDKKIQEGLGLGLSIVKQLTILMGGQISVTSNDGEGSEFTLTLPITMEELHDGIV
jgi:signal transduction histidine kinase